MNRRRWLIVSVMVGCSCGLGNAEEPGPTKITKLGDLKGRIVAITLMSDAEDLVLLSNVSEKQIAGKAFLQGEGVDDGETPDWRNGAEVYIPIGDVQQLVTFTDLKAYKKNLDARPNRVEGKAASARSRRGPRT
jgi:hypothetical protein